MSKSNKAKPGEEDATELVPNDELMLDDEPQYNGNRQLAENGGDNDGVVSVGQINPALDDSDNIETTERKTSEERNGSNNNQTQYAGNQNNEQREVTIASPPVHYSTNSGETNVINEPVVIRQPNGIHVIRTRECCHQQNNYSRERPLKLKHIKILKGFSILAIVLFFPLGIMAMYYAYKSEKEFHAGIMRGSLDLARKLAKRSERLIVFSVLAALLIAVIVFAFVERKLMADDEEYWKYRSNAHFVPAG
ncbi:hypothetical protein ACF0H5_014067 [Mactra antiquata]